MVENNGLELTEQETELYDRQIRLWGLESQKRLRGSRVLLCGLSGFGAEIAKNIILAGIKSLTMLDHRSLSESDICSQFLAPQTELGKNRAESSLIRAQTLNPMVEITVDMSNIDDKPDEFFSKFDVVVVTEMASKTLVKINNACRLQGIKFFAGDVWGLFGYSFTDLQEHNFVEDVMKHKVISKPNEKLKTELVASATKRTILYPPLQDVLSFDYQQPWFLKRLKRTGASYVLLRILQQFRDNEGRDPSYQSRSDDITKLSSIRDEIAPGLVDDAAFVHVFAQISPVAAIVGGELAQEIIKAVSQKEAPHRNIFLFDPDTCCGFVETINCN